MSGVATTHKTPSVDAEYGGYFMNEFGLQVIPKVFTANCRRDLM